MKDFGVVVNIAKNGKKYSKYIHILPIIANDFEEAKQYVEDKYNLIAYNNYIDALNDCDE